MSLYSTGTATGPGAMDAFYQIIRTALTGNGWTEHDVINNTPGQRNIVFRGGALDATAGNRPFMTMEQQNGNTTQIYFRLWHDWDTTAHAGVNVVGNQYSFNLNVQDTSFVYWLKVNSVSIYIVAKIGTFYNRQYAGFARRNTQAWQSGMTKTSGAVASGSTVIPVSSDMTGKLVEGQKILLVNYAHDNSSANKARFELHTIATGGIAASQITVVEATAGNFDSGTLVGENVLPLALSFGITNTASPLSSSSFYLPWYPDATRSGAESQSLTSQARYFGDVNYDGPLTPEGRRTGGAHSLYHSTAAYKGVHFWLYHVYPVVAESPGQPANEDILDPQDGINTFIVLGSTGGSIDVVGPREF